MDMKNSSIYDDETPSERFARKFQEAPIVPIGISGFVGAVLYGIYQYKNRGSMSTSVYVMKFRVIAQGAVVCTLGLGVCVSMFNNYMKSQRKEKKE